MNTWNLDKLDFKYELSKHSEQVLAKKMLNNSCLANSSRDNTFKIWKIKTFKFLKLNLNKTLNKLH